MSSNPFRVRTVVVASLSGLAALGCTDHSNPTSVQAGPVALSVARTPLAFNVGPLGLSGIKLQFPGPNLHLRDVQLSGPVSGYLTGNTNITLNANLDGLGSGPTWGTMTIVTPGGEWQGTLTGHFQGDRPTGILLTSRVVLHGAGQQLLTAECDEIPPSNSETLACSGEVQSPGN